MVCIRVSRQFIAASGCSGVGCRHKPVKRRRHTGVPSSSSASKSKVPIPDVTLVLVDPPLSLHAQSHKKSVLKGLKDPTNHRLPTIQPLKRKRRGKHLDSTTMGATETTSLVANGNGVHKKDDEDMKRLKSYQPCAYRDRIGPSISNEKIHHESPTGPASRSV